MMLFSFQKHLAKIRTGQTGHASHSGNIVVSHGVRLQWSDRQVINGEIRLGKSELGLCETATYKF